MTEIDASGLRGLYALAHAAFLHFPGPEAARFGALLPDDPGQPRALKPSWKPGALNVVDARPTPEFLPLFKVLTEVMRLLCWRTSYTEAEVSRNFLESECYVELMGPRGHFEASDIAFGIMVMGPDCFYPEHRHGPEEIYAPIAGQGEWRYGGRWRTYRAGETVHTPPGAWHALKTRSSTLLILYAWTGGDLAEKSEFAPDARRR